MSEDPLDPMRIRARGAFAVVVARQPRVTDHLRVEPIVWKRFGQWAAHAYVGDRHLCNQVHGQFANRFGNRDPLTTALLAAPLAPSGLPYGKVCQRCIKLARTRKAVRTTGETT